ncbi:unnamed protein product, partial [Brassica oleracea var. botrytis]
MIISSFFLWHLLLHAPFLIPPQLSFPMVQTVGCTWANEFLSDDTVKNVVPEIDKAVIFIREFGAETQTRASRS